jgi:hypothetical protein
MDAILASAGYDALLGLRGTCKAYKDRADTLLLTHCRFCFDHDFAGEERNLKSADVVRTADRRRLPHMYAMDADYLWDPTAEQAATARLGSIRILDIVPGCVQPPQEYLDLRVVRTCEYGDSEIPLMHELRVATHVHFTSLEPSTEEESAVSQLMKKFVLNVQYGTDHKAWTGDYIYMRPDESALDDVVVIFERLPSSAPPSADWDEVWAATQDTLHQILFLNTELWTCGPSHRLTFVDFVPLRTPSDSDTASDWPQVPRFHEMIREHVRDKFQEQQEFQDPERVVPHDKIRECTDKIEFIDGVMYRRRVGDDDMWRLETDRSAFLRPANWTGEEKVSNDSEEDDSEEGDSDGGDE